MKKPTKKQKILEYLQEHVNQAVLSKELKNLSEIKDISRTLRFLRQEGWNLEVPEKGYVRLASLEKITETAKIEGNTAKMGDQSLNVIDFQYIKPGQKSAEDKLMLEVDQIIEENAVLINSKTYFKEKNLIIYNDNILTNSLVPNNSIDLIITSPPYNVDIQYNSNDDRIPYSDYLCFTSEWIRKCYDLAKDDGRFCLNIPLDKNKGGHQSVCADITTIAKQVGWKYHSTIIWNEQNISRRTAWGSWMSASAPYVIAPVEVIVLLYKNEWSKRGGSRISDIKKEEFQEWTNGVWTFCGESKKKVGHPAPFPLELPLRCIKLFSFVGDTVLDPFLGSGTTLVACAKTNRKGIGIDIDKGYCELAKRRIITEGNILQTKLNYL